MRAPKTSSMQLTPPGGAPRMARVVKYGGLTNVYKVPAGYGKPVSLGKIHTPIKR